MVRLCLGCSSGNDCLVLYFLLWLHLCLGSVSAAFHPLLQLSSPFPSFISHPVSPPGATTALFQVLCLFLSFLHVVWLVSLLGQGRSYCLIHFCRKDLGTHQIVIEVQQTIDSQSIL